MPACHLPDAGSLKSWFIDWHLVHCHRVKYCNILSTLYNIHSLINRSRNAFFIAACLDSANVARKWSAKISVDVSHYGNLLAFDIFHSAQVASEFSHCGHNKAARLSIRSYSNFNYFTELMPAVCANNFALNHCSHEKILLRNPQTVRETFT